MRQTSARELLDGWEAARRRSLPMRAAAMAALATGHPLDDVMQWSLPRRDRALFAFHAQTFGSQIEAVASCPHCNEPLEMPLDLSALSAALTNGPDKPVRLRIGRRHVRCRAPNTEDLVVASTAPDVDRARQTLLARCIETSDVTLREQAAALFARDAADVSLALTCPACSHAWQERFDIASFTWVELDNWARRTLGEVDLIARTYGWSEAEILGLSAARRQTYVGMI